MILLKIRGFLVRREPLIFDYNSVKNHALTHRFGGIQRTNERGATVSNVEVRPHTCLSVLCH